MSIPDSSRQLIRTLGKGAYAQVDLVRIPSGHYLARKWIPLKDSESILKERRILQQFRCCPRIVSFYESEIVCREEEDLCVHDLYIEYADGGTLFDIMRCHGGRIADVDHVRGYARMILEGLECMHSKGYVHCDLKPPNVLAFSKNHTHNFPRNTKKYTNISEFWHSVLNKNKTETPKNICMKHETSGTNPSVSSKPNPNIVPWELKLANFGLSREPREEELDEKPTLSWTPEFPFQGTPCYQSPESVKGKTGPEMDIWALGCVVMEMLTGKVIWEDLELEELIEVLAYRELMSEMPQGLSDLGKDFLRLCFQRDPLLRPSASALLLHPWILGLDA